MYIIHTIHEHNSIRQTLLLDLEILDRRGFILSGPQLLNLRRFYLTTFKSLNTLFGYSWRRELQSRIGFYIWELSRRSQICVVLVKLGERIVSIFSFTAIVFIGCELERSIYGVWNLWGRMMWAVSLWYGFICSIVGLK